MPIQWIFSGFALFVCWRAFAAYRRKQLGRRKLLLWIALWSVMVVVLWWPDTTSLFAAFLGVGRGVDAVLYSSIAVLFYALFLTSRKVDALERSLTDLVRALALNDVSKPNDDDGA